MEETAEKKKKSEVLVMESTSELLRRLASRIDNLRMVGDNRNDGCINCEIDIHNSAIEMARNIVLMELMEWN